MRDSGLFVHDQIILLECETFLPRDYMFRENSQLSGDSSGICVC